MARAFQHCWVLMTMSLTFWLGMPTPADADGEATSTITPQHALLQKDVGTWVDSLTPHVTVIHGVYDPTTRTMTHTSEGRDPSSGQKFIRHSTLRYMDDGSRLVEAFGKSDDGKEWKMMEVRYTRREP